MRLDPNRAGQPISDEEDIPPKSYGVIVNSCLRVVALVFDGGYRELANKMNNDDDEHVFSDLIKKRE